MPLASTAYSGRLFHINAIYHDVSSLWLTARQAPSGRCPSGGACPSKRDLVRRAVGRGHGVKQRIRHGGDAQHAPAAGDEHIVLQAAVPAWYTVAPPPGSWPSARPVMGLPFS